MPKKVTEIEMMGKYLKSVIVKASHHATNINHVVLTIAGAIIWAKDSDPIEVMVVDGDMKNVLWAKFNGIRYAFSYNHEKGVIEIRKNSTQGIPVLEFSNESTSEMIWKSFSRL